MPTYAYKCKDCGHHFERMMRLAEHEGKQKVPCPKCKSTKVEQVPAGFQAVTASKT